MIQKDLPGPSSIDPYYTRPHRVPSRFDGYVQPWTTSTARSSSVNPPQTGNDDSTQTPSTTSVDPDPVPPTTFTAPNYPSTSESNSDTVRHSHESHSNDMVSTDQAEEHADFLLAASDYSVDMDTSTLLEHNLRTRDDLDDDDEDASHSSKRQRILIAMAIHSTGLPSTINQAHNSSERDEWIQATNTEYNSLISHNTWKLCELPPDRKAIGCRWLFSKKYCADGTLSYYKARLVAQGFTQIEGIDYTDIFAPVIRISSIRVLLALAAMFSFKVYHMDVQTAFLNGKRQETLYMRQPPGYIKRGDEHLVCRLHKSIYGLKQSSREWNLALDQFFKSHQFQQLKTDPCVYFRRLPQGLVLVDVYVDDFILLSKSLLNTVQRDLYSAFVVKDLGPLVFFLGIEVTRLSDGSQYLQQNKYASDILAKHGLSDCNPISTPQDSSSIAVSSASPSPLLLFRTVMGELLYFSTTSRPDIAYTVTWLSRHLNNPSTEDMQIAKQVLRCLKGTKQCGLLYQPALHKHFQIELFVDADYANDKSTRRSTSGYLIFLNKCLVSWKSKLQNIVTLSTLEAEYISMSYGLHEALWLKSMLAELRLPLQLPITVYEDNQSTIKMDENPTLHQRTKHIVVRHHFIRDLVKQRIIKIEYCSTGKMVADFALPRPKFEEHNETIMTSINPKVPDESLN
ncbi:hypothetical protein LEN26_001247 [Aphanomyces euteiches]|nr:hypothetical protein LEN26_001247 [Aphanomyces euteiches]